MINRQLLAETTVELQVSGKGRTLFEASADIFRKIHKQIYHELDVPIIQMETKEVYFEEIKSATPIKRVMNLNQKNEVTVSAKVILTVKYLDIKEEED